MAVPLSVHLREHAMARLEAGKRMTGQGPISQKWILLRSNVRFGPRLARTAPIPRPAYAIN